MKKVLYILMVMIVGLSIKNVNAYTVPACTAKEMDRLRELASNVEFKTEYKVLDEKKDKGYLKVAYNIKIVNFPEDLKMVYSSSYDTTEVTIKSDTDTIENVQPGSMTFKIYAWTMNLCIDELVKTVNVKLEDVNPYYYFNKEKCDQNPDFKYCKEFMDIGEKSIEDIDKEFDEYLNPSQTSPVKKEEKSDNYLYLIIGGGVLVVGIVAVVIFLIIKKKKKDDL